mmetsp:Transcript_13031/g.18244  ORF Transcript_13031/g.18244 Transcript_13031/m.18244 type:complete len:578 (+) Transcript_13031:34-1767(+)
MLLISWNVAGLSTTLTRIDSDYKSESIATSDDLNTSTSKRSRSHAFSYFLRRHGDPDIVCIQEHKIPLAHLSNRSETLGCSMVAGYESFWACCVDKSKKGFNGVVTYAKCGTVRSANSRPLGSDDLDDQGRVVMTDHGSFVVFNVYAPASCGMSLSYKMKFLNALRRAMATQRRQGKKVILVGDLNISHSGIDVHWKFRSIRVNDIIQECKADATMGDVSENLPEWKMQLQQHWETIQSALSSIEAIPVTTKNVTTGSTHEKFRARVTVGNPGSERKMFLGDYETSPEYAIGRFSFDESNYFDHDLSKDCISMEANVVSLNTLAELMAKIVKVEWDTSTLRLISNTEGLKKSSPIVRWLSDVLKDDGMVDTFRHVFPGAEGRYTCWNQQTNRRFDNMGTRIDYTITDTSLMGYIDNDGSQRLRCCNYPHAETKFCSEEAALHACTASGLFQGASFEGGGIATATKRALDTQFGNAHTGIIYTPPQYSDHVAVSLLLNEEFNSLISSSLVLNGKDTKQAQPHKTQKSISSFFMANKSPSGKCSTAITNTPSSKRKLTGNVEKSNKKRGTIMCHFSKKK